MRILVIGASGLIGSAVCAHLAAEGHEVVGMSRHPPVAGLAQVKHVVIGAGASADILIGLAILYRPTSRYGLYAALLVSVAYEVIGTLWCQDCGVSRSGRC